MEPKPNSHIIAVTLLAIVLSAAVTGGIVYLMQNKQNTTTKNDLQAQVDTLKSQIAALPTATPTPIALASPTATATPASSASPAVATDPTAAWKIYTDTSGLSFKYPATWTKYAGNGNNSPQILISPTTDTNQNHLNLTYYFGGTITKPAITDTAHSGYVAEVTPLSISGSTKSYYLVAAGFSSGLVSDIFVSDTNYTIGNVTNLSTTFTTPKGIVTSLKAELLPSGVQNNPGASYSSYTSHPDYGTLVTILKSLTD